MINKAIFVLLGAFLPTTLFVQKVLAAPVDDYVITIQTDKSGLDTDSYYISTSNKFKYNYNVDCNNDGVNEVNGQTGSYRCEYANLGGAGIYTIRIKDNTGTRTGFPYHYGRGGTAHQKKILSLDQWGTGKWKNMEETFMGASSLIVSATDIPDFSGVTDMGGMFANASLANPDTSGWDTSSVTDMSLMFFNATSATPDTSGWDTSFVYDMFGMFSGALSSNPDTSGWDTARVEDMNSMFAGATSADPDTSGWDTHSVSTMVSMFAGAISANPDTSSWKTGSVTNMSGMFSGAISANPNTSSWDLSAVTNMTNMFRGVALPIEDYDAMLIDFNSKTLQPSVIFDGGNSKYCKAEDARENIITFDGWIITDGGKDCSSSAYTIGGSVSGLASGNNVVLQNNAGDDLSVSLNGSFTFLAPLSYGSSYLVTVLAQSNLPSQTCNVINGSGTVASSNITNVRVNCVDNLQVIPTLQEWALTLLSILLFLYSRFSLASSTD